MIELWMWEIIYPFQVQCMCEEWRVDLIVFLWEGRWFIRQSFSMYMFIHRLLPLFFLLVLGWEAVDDRCLVDLLAWFKRVSRHLFQSLLPEPGLSLCYDRVWVLWLSKEEGQFDIADRPDMQSETISHRYSLHRLLIMPSSFLIKLFGGMLLASSRRRYSSRQKVNLLCLACLE